MYVVYVFMQYVYEYLETITITIAITIKIVYIRNSTPIYLLLASWLCADVVNLETTRVRARFSARRRSFSVFSFCNS